MADQAAARLTSTGIEIPLLGGDVTEGVVRVGDTVRRPGQPWSGAVAGYLTHLARVGFDAAPRWLGVDDRGRDVLDYVDGAVPGQPPEPWASTDRVLADVARLLRRLHDASAPYRPPPDAAWFGSDQPSSVPADLPALFEQPELVSHCDLTPQNVVFRGGRPVALIDFDLTRPTTRLADLTNTATWWVPLLPPESDRCAIHTGAPAAARLRLFVDAYGLDRAGRAELVDLAIRMMRRRWYSMRANAEQRGGGWARMWSDGLGDRIRDREAWLIDHSGPLTAALF